VASVVVVVVLLLLIVEKGAGIGDIDGGGIDGDR
jgi:preprotein translocase subunit SecG